MKIKRIDSLESFNRFEYSIYKLIINNPENFFPYPNIFDWIISKVSIDLNNSKRIIYIAMDDYDELSGIAILKKDKTENKICTLFVSKEYRRKGIGTRLLELSTNWLGSYSPLITMPIDSKETIGLIKFLLHEKKYTFKFSGFFESDGYYNIMYNNSIERKNTALMSIKPYYSEEILSGEKLVEFRKVSFNKKINNIIIYSTTPDRKILGYFKIKNIETGSEESIWDKYKDLGGISRENFFKYYKDSPRAVAIVIDKVHKFSNPIDPKSIIPDFKAPQSFLYL